MRSFLYLLSLVFALPSVGLAAAFLVQGSAITTKSAASFIGVLLDTGIWLLPWGLLACFIAFVMLVAGGLTHRLRRFASLCVAVLAIASSALVLILTTLKFSPERPWFLVAAAVSALLSISIARRESSRYRLARKAA